MYPFPLCASPESLIRFAKRNLRGIYHVVWKFNARWKIYVLVVRRAFALSTFAAYTQEKKVYCTFRNCASDDTSILLRIQPPQRGFSSLPFYFIRKTFDSLIYRNQEMYPQDSTCKEYTEVYILSTIKVFSLRHKSIHEIRTASGSIIKTIL